MDQLPVENQQAPVAQDPSVEQHSHRNIIFGTLIGYLGLVLAVVVRLVFTPMIIASIGEGAYGVYSLAGSLIDLFVLDFGLGVTVNTFLARYRAEGKKEEIKKFLATMYRLYFILDLIVLAVFVVIYFLVDPLYQGLTIDEKSQFKVVWIISGVFSLISFPCSIFGGTLSAYEEYIWIKVIDVVNKILYILFISLSLAFNWGLYALVIIQSGANLFCIGIKYLVMHFKLGVKADFHYRTTWKDTKGIIVYSLWAAIVSICSRLIFSVTPSILGIVSNSTNITVFSTAAALEACTYLFSSVMSGFFLPKISRIYSDKTLDSGKEITALGIRVGKIQYFIMALIFVGFACCGQEFVRLWLGDSEIYNPVYAGTLVMIAYDLFSIPEIVFNTAMYANNNLKHLTLSMIITSSINVGLSFLLSYYYGAFGACMAIGISRFVQLFIDNYFYKKDLHISLWPFAKAVFTKPSITAFVALGVGLLMLFFMPTSPAWTFAIQVCSMIVVYCVVGWFVSFDKEERQLIKDQSVSFIKRG